jgi:hypothetical protein
MDFPGASNDASRLEPLQVHHRMAAFTQLCPRILSGVNSNLWEGLPDIVMSGSTLIVPLEIAEGNTPKTHSPRGLATRVQIPACCYFGAYVPHVNCMAVR